MRLIRCCARFAIGLLVASPLAIFSILPADAAEPDLTGVWHTPSGATLYVRQLGTIPLPTAPVRIYWYGTGSAGNSFWAHVASGELDGDQINVRWVDIPPDESRNFGVLTLKIIDPDHLVLVANPERFANGLLGDTWFRGAAAGGANSQPPPSPQSAGGDYCHNAKELFGIAPPGCPDN